LNDFIYGKGRINLMQNFSKEFLETVGSIAVNFTYLEYSLIKAISKLSEDNHSAPYLMTLLLAPDSFGILLSKYRKVVIYLLSLKNLYDTKMKSELNILNEELMSLSGRRTTVIHSFWTINDNGELTRAKYKKDIKDEKILEDKNITLQSIYDLPDDIMKEVKKLSAFNRNIIKLLGL
jgi:hypothetical protein